MTAVTVRTPALLSAPTASRSLWSKLGRAALAVVGAILVLVGLVGAVLPGHLGVPVLVVGLILLLRSSTMARRQFIGLQRRHPNIIFPIRRLLRREPELAPVAWQQVLRAERLVLPRRWRMAGRMRRRHFRRRTPDQFSSL